MKKVKDTKYSARDRWLTTHPNALYLQASDLFRCAWREVANNDDKAIALISKRGMAGVIVPSKILSEFNKKIPSHVIDNPIKYVTKVFFKDEFELCKSYLDAGSSLIVTDNNGNDIFGVASKEFSSQLKTDDHGHVKFADDIDDYIFPKN